MGRFPEDFMFQLTNQEVKNWTLQIMTSGWGVSRHDEILTHKHLSSQHYRERL